jgi:8-oxo-dGTP diphosphatase
VKARESRWPVTRCLRTRLICFRSSGPVRVSAVFPHVLVANVSEMAVGFTYLWHERPVPAGLEVRQVYGYLLCPQTARVLIQDVGEGKFNLPGGTPEVWDADMRATLAREAMEESQVLVTAAVYLGYQEVRENWGPPFAQVRMAGLIGRFEPRAPDPDGGRLFRRFMTSLDDAPTVLGWGEPAVAQAAAAARVAAELWKLPVAAPAPAGYADLPRRAVTHGAFSCRNAVMLAA